MPKTFYIKSGVKDQQYDQFIEFYKFKQKEIDQMNIAEKPKNSFIIKIGEKSKDKNFICKNGLNEILEIIQNQQTYKDGNLITYIVQQYIDKTILYNKKKFDLKCFILITSQNGLLKGYWYQEGFIQIKGDQALKKNTVNPPIQQNVDNSKKKKEDQNVAENKFSFQYLEKFLSSYYPEVNFQKQIVSQMKEIARLLLNSQYNLINPLKRDNTFELFLLDFIIDENFNVQLLEANTNPNLQINSAFQSRLIPNLVENIIRLIIDPIFIPPQMGQDNIARLSKLPENIFQENKFELIFDELIEGKYLKQKIIPKKEVMDIQIYEFEKIDELEID